MSRFVQLHVLTSYPPANLNRDEQGRTKTAKMGGFERLRISSQCLKRAWRDSALFENVLSDHIGTRTKRIGLYVKDKLLKKGIDEKRAKEWASLIASPFGSLEDPKKRPDKELETKQLVHISLEEWQAIDVLIDVLVAEKRKPEKEEVERLPKRKIQAVDIAFFGRMLADNQKFNIEAAVQVAHAITIHAAPVEYDYFTAVDDLKKKAEEDEFFKAVDDLNDPAKGRGEDAGAAHIGEGYFGAGVFYIYICINLNLLVENLSGNKELAKKALSAFIEAVAKVSPPGKQNSFASHAYASYIMAEKGDQQPRSLSSAFLRPVAVTGDDEKSLVEKGIKALEIQRDKINKAYGDCVKEHKVMNLDTGEGNLQEIREFVTAYLDETE